MAVQRVDAFGNVQFGDGPAFRGRVIQMSGLSFAVFREDHQAPAVVELSEPAVIKGRTMTGTFADEVHTRFVMQRASCGCSTPSHLRGPARRFLETLNA